MRRSRMPGTRVRLRHAGPASIFIGLFCAGFAALTLLAEWHALPAWLLSVNVATLAAYAYDKQAAMREWRRVPELTLHTLAFLGGSPAALLGQQAFRHKTAKPSFLVVFWLILVAQVALLGWQLTR